MRNIKLFLELSPMIVIGILLFLWGYSELDNEQYIAMLTGEQNFIRDESAFILNAAWAYSGATVMLYAYAFIKLWKQISDEKANK